MGLGLPLSFHLLAPPPARRDAVWSLAGLRRAGADFIFLHNKWAGRPELATGEPSVPPLFPGGVGGSRVGLYQPRPAFALDLVKETNGFLKTVLIHPLKSNYIFPSLSFRLFLQVIWVCAMK